jgi:phosphoribosylaminoimidazolecarboxamide formyltransferase / IMP cyclohydrolase
VPVRRALLSVTDKAGLVDFARRLAARKVELLSTGGTARALEDAKIPVTRVERATGFPEVLGGRVKTLHPAIAAGILALDTADHSRELAQHGIGPIDLVCVNLYPFEEAVARGGSLADVLENIDVGGPTLIRAAAKNHPRVAVVTHPSQYDAIAKEIEATGGVADATRLQLAAHAFALVARYDIIIDQYFRHKLLKTDFPGLLNLTYEKLQDLRYGENAHQRAAFYRSKPTREPCVVNARQLHGKELSYNNILDCDVAIELVKEFRRPSAGIIKHATPCGVASSDSALGAWRDAYACDTYSPFGGIVGLNRQVDLATAEEMGKLFLEAIAAPGYAPDALTHLEQKKNLRVLEVPGLDGAGHWGGLQVRSITGGLLMEDRDILEPDLGLWRVVTRTKPDEEMMRSMVFAFKTVRHVRSNSVVFVRGERTVGVGGGQTARVDAARIGMWKAGEQVKRSIMASDAFFPFRDAVDEAARAGVAGIVQPGGSIRDSEVIAAADEAGLAMVFTGQRAFRH